jgi:hypothetical protein
VYDAPKKKFAAPPPFPTFVPSEAELVQQAKWAAGLYLSAAEEAALAAAGGLPEAYEREPPFELIMQPAAVNPFSIPENDDAEQIE